jgi:putative tryptophan/tyrosine transport system substrate-binding protein
MKRRCVLPLVMLGLMAVLGSGFAQQPGRIPTVGVLITHAPLTDPVVENFRSGFRALGYEDGRNIRLEFVTARGQLDQLPVLAQQLVDGNVDAIISPNEVSARAAQKATNVIPIVMFAWSDDPVTLGLVASYSRPGGNITGVYSLAADLEVKRLEIIKEIVPNVSRVAAFWDPSFRGQPVEVQHAGQALGLRVDLIEVRSSEELQTAFRTAKQKRAGTVLLTSAPIFYVQRDRVAALGLGARMPTVAASGEQVRAGCLMAYGIDIDELYKRAAYYVDRLLKGAKASELPVERIAKFKLTVNLRTAKALGVTVPQSVLFRADEVIR